MNDGIKTWMNNWWRENSWKWKEKAWARAAPPLPIPLVVVSDANAAKHLQSVTIEMIDAVAVVKKKIVWKTSGTEAAWQICRAKEEEAR